MSLTGYFLFVFFQSSFHFSVSTIWHFDFREIVRCEEGGRVKFRCFFDAKAERVHDICVCWKTEKCVFEAVKTMRGSFWESVVGSVGQRSQNKEQVCLFWFFLFLINIRTNSRNTWRRSVACRKSNRRVFYRSQTAEDGPTLSSSSANIHVWTFSTHPHRRDPSHRLGLWNRTLQPAGSTI